MIGILRTQHKLKIDISIKLPIHCTFKANAHSFGAWTARVPCDLLQALVALDFDPAASAQSSPHRWISYSHTEVFFALLWHERLVQGPRLGRLGACILISVIHHCCIILLVIFILLAISSVAIAIKPLINAVVIVIMFIHSYAHVPSHLQLSRLNILWHHLALASQFCRMIQIRVGVSILVATV